MPVLQTERKTKKIVLPSSTPTDEAWVEIYEDIVAGDVIGMMSAGQDVNQATILAITGIIKSWNFTTKEGEIAEVNTDNVKFLPYEDLMEIVTKTTAFDKFQKLDVKKNKP